KNMTAQFQLDLQDLLAMQKDVINHSRTHEVKRNYFKWTISIIIPFVFIMINVSLVSLIMSLITAVAFFLVAPSLYPKIAFFRLKSKFEQQDHSKLLKPCEIHLSEEGIKRVIDGETTQFLWKEFRKMHTDESHYFLYIDDLQGIIIPKQPTVENNDMTSFQDQLESYANDYISDDEETTE